MAANQDAQLPRPLTPGDEVPEIAERIMIAAIRLFGRKGYAATSVREIVQEADVTNPMLYYYFDSKEGLFRQLMEFLFAHMQTRIAEIVDDDDLPAREKLSAIATTHLEGVREHPEALRFIYSAIFGPRESRPDIDVHEMHMHTHNMVQSVFGHAVETGELELRPGIDPSVAAEWFLGAINQDLMRTLGVLDMCPGADPQIIQELTGVAAVERITAFFLGGVGHFREDVHP